MMNEMTRKDSVQIMRYELNYPEIASLRIDKYINEQIPELSRSFIQQLIKNEEVLINGKVCKANYKCKPSDTIIVEYEEAKELEVVAENIPLDIVYEDADVVIVNKPKNMVVHPAAGHENGTLVNALLYHCKDSLSSINCMIIPSRCDYHL